MDTDEIIWIASSHNDFYRGIVFTGGDPLEQPEALYELASKVDFPKVLYTGRKYEEIKPELRDLFDIIVDGPYVEELKTGGFPASSNQAVTRKGK
jgi:anaerobic ribonucleoside-triphosphate reductase activating protein